MPPSAIRALVRDEARARRELGRDDIPLRVIDVRDPATLRDAFEGCAAIVHTAAVAIDRRGGFTDVNVRGVAHVIAEARRSGIQRLVHISAIGADPVSPYPFLRSKGEGQRIIETSGIPHVVLRPSLLFGPGDDFFQRLAFSLRFPIVPVIGNGRARFQPLHVEDLAQCAGVALQRDDLLGRAYDIGGPEIFTYDELLTDTMAALGIAKPRLHLPTALLKPAAFAMQLAMDDPLVTPQQLDLLGVDNVARPNEIGRFGVRPQPLRGGLNYLRSRRDSVKR